MIAAISAYMAEFKGIMYAAKGTSTLYVYSSDGDTWTATDLTDGYAERFQKEANLLDSFATLNEVKDAFATYGYSFLYHKPWFGLFSHPIGSYLRNVVDHGGGAKDFKAKKIRKTHFNLLFKKLHGIETKIELQRNENLEFESK